ncbi:MAG: PEP-CTERM sorting domain-containing protein [Phycisphaeraceae bacterium]
MVRSVQLCLALVVSLVLAASSHAAVQDFNGQWVDVEYWAGSGSNAAVLVVDFGSGNNYAFGYRWDDEDTFTRVSSPTTTPQGQNWLDTPGNGTGAANLSEAMVLAMANYGGGEALSLTYRYTQFGLGVESLSYQGHTMLNDFVNTWPNIDSNIALWLSGYPAYTDWFGDPHDASPADGQTWISSPEGASTRMLSDGYYDGWSWASGSAFPDAPVTPIPEPVSLAMLGMGATLLMFRRRKSA